MNPEGQKPRGRLRSWLNRLGKKLHRRKIEHGKHVGDGAQKDRDRQRGLTATWHINRDV